MNFNYLLIKSILFQIAMLKFGGNGQILDYFKRLNVENLAINHLYLTKAASHYRQRLKERVEKIMTGEIIPEIPKFDNLNLSNPASIDDADSNSTKQQSLKSKETILYHDCIFDKGKMGLTLAKDYKGSATVIKIIPGGSADKNGVQMNDTVIGIMGKAMDEYDEVMHMITCMERPIKIRFSRVMKNSQSSYNVLVSSSTSMKNNSLYSISNPSNISSLSKSDLHRTRSTSAIISASPTSLRVNNNNSSHSEVQHQQSGNHSSSNIVSQNISSPRQKLNKNFNRTSKADKYEESSSDSDDDDDDEYSSKGMIKNFKPNLNDKNRLKKPSNSMRSTSTDVNVQNNIADLASVESNTADLEICNSSVNCSSVPVSNDITAETNNINEANESVIVDENISQINNFHGSRDNESNLDSQVLILSHHDNMECQIEVNNEDTKSNNVVEDGAYENDVDIEVTADDEEERSDKDIDNDNECAVEEAEDRTGTNEDASALQDTLLNNTSVEFADDLNNSDNIPSSDVAHPDIIIAADSQPYDTSEEEPISAYLQVDFRLT